MEASFVHAASVAPNCTMASDFVGSWVREDDLIVEPMVFEEGSVPVSMAPGLGCELDMAAVERFSQGYETIRA